MFPIFYILLAVATGSHSHVSWRTKTTMKGGESDGKCLKQPGLETN